MRRHNSNVHAAISGICTVVSSEAGPEADTASDESPDRRSGAPASHRVDAEPGARNRGPSGHRQRTHPPRQEAHATGCDYLSPARNAHAYYAGDRGAERLVLGLAITSITHRSEHPRRSRLLKWLYAPPAWPSAMPNPRVRRRAMLNRKLDARVSDELLGYPGRSKLGHRPGAIFLAGPPLEELLQGAVLAAGVGIAVAAQQPHHPPLDVLPADRHCCVVPSLNSVGARSGCSAGFRW